MKVKLENLSNLCAAKLHRRPFEVFERGDGGDGGAIEHVAVVIDQVEVEVDVPALLPAPQAQLLDVHSVALRQRLLQELLDFHVRRSCLKLFGCGFV